MQANILKAAEQLRRDIEAFALFWCQSQDVEINIQPHHETKLTSLMGACGIASWVFYRACRSVGIDATLWVGSYAYSICGCGCGNRNTVGHCWVTIGEQVVDLTATQFGKAHEIYVTARGEDPDYRYVENQTNTLAEKKLTVGWDTQSPFFPHYKEDLDEMIERTAAALMAPASYDSFLTQMSRFVFKEQMA